jgi:hypothetical protein
MVRRIKEPPMDTLPTVPLTIDPEAAARVAELGMQAELEQMLEHARRTIPGLQRLDVVLDPPYDTGDEPAVVIEALRDPATRAEPDQTWWHYSGWEITTFPPDVCRHFSLLILYGSNHAG